ncbi:uncharacterized protein LOC118183716 [Stegodyphus dumicola]|uniref:uncharacterized protein LOC118183716 n=1 Tax=Stegodyphus dumicola TaxID=202533 RepID=UPI0015AD2DF0|nr:uncharacterized protein LOC118183716 [Stegodyphus dumicola]
MFKDYYSTCTKVCDKDNEFRRWYLESAKCLNEQREQLTECENIPHLRESSEFARKLCSSLKNWLRCGYEKIEEKCGSKALLVAKEIISFNYNFLENSCKKYQLSNIKMLRSISATLYE